MIPEPIATKLVDLFWLLLSNHPNTIWSSGDDGSMVRLMADGIPIYLFQSDRYEDTILDIGPYRIRIIYSDVELSVTDPITQHRRELKWT